MNRYSISNHRSNILSIIAVSTHIVYVHCLHLFDLMIIYSAKATLHDNLLHIYFILHTHTLTNCYFFFFVLKSIYTYRWRLKIVDAILVDVLQLTNWIIAGNSPKCNNMIYFIAFNLKFDCSNEIYYHFLFLTL